MINIISNRNDLNGITFDTVVLCGLWLNVTSNLILRVKFGWRRSWGDPGGATAHYIHNSERVAILPDSEATRAHHATFRFKFQLRLIVPSPRTSRTEIRVPGIQMLITPPIFILLTCQGYVLDCLTLLFKTIPFMM